MACPTGSPKENEHIPKKKIQAHTHTHTQRGRKKTPRSASVPETKGIYATGHFFLLLLFFFFSVPFLEFMYLVFTRMPGGVTVSDSVSVVVALVCQALFSPFVW